MSQISGDSLATLDDEITNHKHKGKTIKNTKLLKVRHGKHSSSTSGLKKTTGELGSMFMDMEGKYKNENINTADVLGHYSDMCSNLSEVLNNLPPKKYKDDIDGYKEKYMESIIGQTMSYKHSKARGKNMDVERDHQAQNKILNEALKALKACLAKLQKLKFDIPGELTNAMADLGEQASGKHSEGAVVVFIHRIVHEFASITYGSLGKKNQYLDDVDTLKEEVLTNLKGQDQQGANQIVVKFVSGMSDLLDRATSDDANSIEKFYKDPTKNAKDEDLDSDQEEAVKDANIKKYLPAVEAGEKIIKSQNVIGRGTGTKRKRDNSQNGSASKKQKISQTSSKSVGQAGDFGAAMPASHLAWLVQQGGSLIDVNGDGLCFLRAVLKGLNRDENEAVPWAKDAGVNPKNMLNPTAPDGQNARQVLSGYAPAKNPAVPSVWVLSYNDSSGGLVVNHVWAQSGPVIIVVYTDAHYQLLQGIILAQLLDTGLVQVGLL
ncbi:MAG: hypothetical protein H0T73_16095 [Ardenticatenales bacterium]|nr:hypothetical protein [Ardenticatenales bacterium]